MREASECCFTQKGNIVKAVSDTSSCLVVQILCCCFLAGFNHCTKAHNNTEMMPTYTSRNSQMVQIASNVRRLHHFKLSCDHFTLTKQQCNEGMHALSVFCGWVMDFTHSISCVIKPIGRLPKNLGLPPALLKHLAVPWLLKSHTNSKDANMSILIRPGQQALLELTEYGLAVELQPLDVVCSYPKSWSIAHGVTRCC